MKISKCFLFTISLYFSFLTFYVISISSSYSKREVYPFRIYGTRSNIYFSGSRGYKYPFSPENIDEIFSRNFPLWPIYQNHKGENFLIYTHGYSIDNFENFNNTVPYHKSIYTNWRKIITFQNNTIYSGSFTNGFYEKKIMLQSSIFSLLVFILLTFPCMLFIFIQVNKK